MMQTYLAHELLLLSHAGYCLETKYPELTCASVMQSGTKLLYAEVKIALRLIKKTLHGHSLTRSAFQTLWQCV